MTAAENSDVSSQVSPHWPAPRGRALILCLAALALGAGAAYGLARSNAGSSLGYLEAQSVVLSVGVAGKIDEIAAAEGMRVEPGQKVLVIVDEALASQVSAQRRRVEVLHSELNQARARADIDLKWRMKELDAEILETRLKAAGFLQSQYDQEIEQFAWTDFLKESLIDPVEFIADKGIEHVLNSAVGPAQQPRESRIRVAIRKEAVGNALEVSRAQVEMCAARLKELETLKQDLPQQLARSHGVEAAESRVAEATEELKRLEGRPCNVELKSPIHGTVGIYRRMKGDQVAAGESIVTILDEDQRYLTLRIPSRQAPEFPAGGPVLLEFPGGQTRAGRIRAIPPQALAGGLETPTIAPQDSLISLRIDPVAKLWPVVPVGTAVNVRPAK